MMRRILDGDPDVLAKTSQPETLLGIAVGIIGDRIVKRTGVGLAYRRHPAASGMPFQDEASVKEAVLEDLDLLDRLIARGALRFGSYDALYQAVALPDTMVAELLLRAGAEQVPGPGSGNRLMLQFAAEQSACKGRMLSLLEQYETSSGMARKS